MRVKLVWFKESNSISKNMTELTSHQVQFSLMVSTPFSGPKLPKLTHIIKSGTVHKFRVLRKPCGGHLGLIWAIWRKGYFGHVFRYGVTLFKPNFISPPWSKMRNFSAHQKAEELTISKLTLLLFLVPFLGELWPLKTWGHFFWDTL